MGATCQIGAQVTLDTAESKDRSLRQLLQVQCSSAQWAANTANAGAAEDCDLLILNYWPGVLPIIQTKPLAFARS